MLHNPLQAHSNGPMTLPPGPPTIFRPPSTHVHSFELAQHPHDAPAHLHLPLSQSSMEPHRPPSAANSNNASRHSPHIQLDNSIQSYGVVYHAPPHPQNLAVPQPPRKKQARAAQACDFCRERKRKCDEQRPCQYCREENVVDRCIYKAVPIPKKDQSIENLQRTMDGAVQVLLGMTKATQTLADMKQMLETVVAQVAPPVKVESPSQDVTAQETYHTTTAHHLLNWPSMEQFYKGIDYLEHLLNCGREVPDYPMLVELDRGTFCTLDVSGNDKPSHEGFISTSSCAFTSERLEAHFRSYLGTFHILHPFLDPSKLRHMFDGIKSGPVRNTKAPRAKRKRGSEEPPYKTEASLSNAIALMVAALGAAAVQADLPTLYSASSANAHISPGMVYFAPAWDILLANSSERTIVHAQAMILASLFLNQYGRVYDAWLCVNEACETTYNVVVEQIPMLVRDSTVFMSEEGHYEATVLKFAYWTCLQLESDILAEWSTLPPSKIRDLQYMMGFPHYYEPSAESSKLMCAYSAQIWLQRFLNELLIQLYGGDQALDVTKSAQELQGWKNVQPRDLSWSDSDPPSIDVNLARLRAKYYGARSVVFRGSLHHAIKYPETLVDIEGVHKCIESAILSTIAFDRVGADAKAGYTKYERQPGLPMPALTNIVGTLHAQSGNIILLAAAYKSRVLPLLPKDTNLTKPNLSALLRRTRHAISPYIGNSPILSIDLAILRTICVACDL